MATLQKIRNRGGVLVSIVIGLALVAFIVGDALSSGASFINNSRNKVGEVAGKSIGIQEYQQRIAKNEKMITQMNGLTGLTDEQQAAVRENTWQQIISEIILNNQYEEIGMGLSGDELYDLLLGNNMTPEIAQLFADPTTGQVDKQRAIETIKYLINSPAGTPQREYWLNMEEQIKTSQLQMKYMNLLGKGLYVTDEQARAYLESSATNVDISYIMKSYNTVSDSAVSVSASEIQKYYNEHQYLFEQQESRQIAYVNFDITASAEDIQETEDWVSSLKEEFAAAADPVEFANLSSEQKVSPSYYKRGELGNDALDEFFFTQKSDSVYGPYMQGNSYNIARVANRKMLPDSVRARHILIVPTQETVVSSKALADSLAQLIRDGKDFEALAREYSADQNSAVNGGDLGWFTQAQMIQPFSDSVFFAKKKEVKVVATQYGFHVVQVTDMTKPVEKIRLAVITKEIVPSQQTVNKIYNDARTFASDVNTEAEFNEAVTKYNQTKRLANLGKNDRTIPGITSGREVVREAFLASEPGYILTTTKDKSPIFETGDKFTIAVLLNIKEEGIAPLGEVRALVQRELIRQKKGEMIAKQLEGSIAGSESLLSVAQKAGAEVVDATDLNFNSLQIPGAGIEPKVIAEVLKMNEGKISKPIIGNQGVYVVIVNAKNTTEVTPEQIQEAKLQMDQLNMNRVNYQLLPALEKKEGVVDERYKFY